MPKLRKMLGDISSRECISLMVLIQTQSCQTLAAWAISYAKEFYLPIYQSQYHDSHVLSDTIALCQEYLKGNKTLAQLRPALKDAAEAAKAATASPQAQAAARAVSVACSSVRTPTNSLGFLFYGAAAVSYAQAGLSQSSETYDRLASAELTKALASLKAVSVADEPNPAKINWNC